MLAMDSPLLDPDSTLQRGLVIADMVITALFVFECIAKIIVMGFVANSGSYLSNGWNVLDFVIVCTSLLTYLGNASDTLKALRTLRTLRALRPLRVISRNPGLKLVVNALFRAIPSILNVLFVCVLFFLIFGIIGVTYFKGAFHICQGQVFDALSPEQVELVTYPIACVCSGMFCDGNERGRRGLIVLACVLQPGMRRYPSRSKRGVPACTLVSRQRWCASGWVRHGRRPFRKHSTTSCERVARCLKCPPRSCGWTSCIRESMLAVRCLACTSELERRVTRCACGCLVHPGADMQPVQDSGVGWVIFFIAFMVMGSLFIMNLFVGVVIDNFNRMKEEMGENMLLTQAQREWVRAHEILLHIKPVAKVVSRTQLLSCCDFNG